MPGTASPPPSNQTQRPTQNPEIRTSQKGANALSPWCCPGQVYALVVFESEEKARAREQDPRRQEALQAARAIMADIFDRPPEFTDLTVADEWTG